MSRQGVKKLVLVLTLLFKIMAVLVDTLLFFFLCHAAAFVPFLLLLIIQL